MNFDPFLWIPFSRPFHVNFTLKSHEIHMKHFTWNTRTSCEISFTSIPVHVYITELYATRYFLLPSSIEKIEGYDVNVRVTKMLPSSACYLDAILWNADAGCCILYHKPGKKTEKSGEERFEEKGLRRRSEVPINPIHPTLYHWSSLSSNFCSVLYNMLSFIMSNNGHVKYLKETMLQPSRRWNHSKF